jgi:HEPN domain-containing protein
MGTARDLAGEWLRKARNDVVTARHTLELPAGPTDTVCFHARQAVEKVLKGLLTAREIAFPRTHNVLLLADGVDRRAGAGES